MSGALNLSDFDLPRSHCELCGSANIQPYHRDFRDITIFKCRACGIQFMNPQYTDAYLESYYATYTKDEAHWEEPLHYCHDFYMSLVEKHLAGPGSLLDVGSGGGYLLTAAKRRGWECIGYDVDAQTTAKVSEKIGVEIRSGDFTSIDWGRERYEAVTLHQVLEHLKSPVPYLQIIGDALRDNGILLIGVPNIHSLSASMKFGLEKLGLRKHRIGAYYDTSHHLWYYTPRTLRDVLNRFGFEIVHRRSGHRARPNQSALKRAFMRTITDRPLWRSTMLILARKQPTIKT
jgi:2-polyprenyl-3-methyl-5-hydroxy-6-metoxy-1,4-benzoquinol methylase